MKAALRARSLWAIAILLIAGGAIVVAASSALPSLEGRSVSAAIADTADTTLGRAISRRAAEHPGASGIYPLADSLDAFAARMLLARAAERSLDVQYYIWRDDLSGSLLFEALREAAERGVRVRLLLDDNNTVGLDATLAALDAHPNIEVRLFNPFVIRSPRWIGYLTDFSRLNRRMHNKSFTADNQATIVGGRNVADEYFAASEGVVFADVDVLAVGRVVRDVSNDFDRYWASGSSYPVGRLLARSEAPLPFERDPAAAPYLDAVRNAGLVRALLRGRLAFEWVAARLVSDDPAKGLGRAEPQALVTRELKDILGNPARRVDVVSAYFAPAGAGTAALVDLARRGVKVRVLTNSLEATDVAAVHAGYAKRRGALLAAGIKLYELRRLAPSVAERKGGRLVGSSGSSAASLHAKTFAVDGARVFIGSFNFDERSAYLNTEMGLVIDSPALAGRIEQTFEGRIPAEAYEVGLAPTGELYWLERRSGELVRHDEEPGTTGWQRTAVYILSLLPIDWLL